MKNKKGVITMIEVTIAILIVAVTILYVYTNNQPESPQTTQEYIEGIQKKILDDIGDTTEFRLNVLNTEVDNSSDGNFTILDQYASQEMPENLGYVLRICGFGVACKMSSEDYMQTRDKDIYVRDTFVISEIGSGGSEAIFNPSIVRLYVWEK